MTWITLAVGRASSPHSTADAERPERHSHAERRNDQRDLGHADHTHAPRGHAAHDALRHIPEWTRRSDQYRLLRRVKLILDVANLGPAMRRGLSVFTQIDEHHLLDRQDALAGDLVADLTHQSD